ncbi:35655_t:CDS:1, partial [Gigaspora margarita]
RESKLFTKTIQISYLTEMIKWMKQMLLFITKKVQTDSEVLVAEEPEYL